MDGTFTTIDFPGADRIVAQGINARGAVAGFYEIWTMQHGFLYVGGTFTTIDFPGASNTKAQGINDRGEIVGVEDAGGTHGFLATPGPAAP